MDKMEFTNSFTRDKNETLKQAAVEIVGQERTDQTEALKADPQWAESYKGIFQLQNGYEFLGSDEDAATEGLKLMETANNPENTDNTLANTVASEGSYEQKAAMRYMVDTYNAKDVVVDGVNNYSNALGIDTSNSVNSATVGSVLTDNKSRQTDGLREASRIDMNQFYRDPENLKGLEKESGGELDPRTSAFLKSRQPIKDPNVALTEDQLMTDPQWINDQKVIADLMGDVPGMYDPSLGTAGNKQDQRYANYGFEQQSEMIGSLYGTSLDQQRMGGVVPILQKFINDGSPEQLDAMIRSLKTYDDKPMTVAGWGRALKNLPFDITNFALPGMGLAAKGVKALAGKSLSWVFRQKLLDTLYKKVLGAAVFEGASMGFVDNLENQRLMVAGGEQTEIDLVELGLVTGASGTIGAVVVSVPKAVTATASGFAKWVQKISAEAEEEMAKMAGGGTPNITENPIVSEAKQVLDKKLYATHRTSINNLSKMLDEGVLPAPSFAIAKNSKTSSEFGDIIMIPKEKHIDPTKGAYAFGGDVWTPRINFDPGKEMTVLDLKAQVFDRIPKLKNLAKSAYHEDDFYNTVLNDEYLMRHFGKWADSTGRDVYDLVQMATKQIFKKEKPSLKQRIKEIKKLIKDNGGDIRGLEDAWTPSYVDEYRQYYNMEDFAERGQELKTYGSKEKFFDEVSKKIDKGEQPPADYMESKRVDLVPLTDLDRIIVPSDQYTEVSKMFKDKGIEIDIIRQRKGETTNQSIKRSSKGKSDFIWGGASIGLIPLANQKTEEE